MSAAVRLRSVQLALLLLALPPLSYGQLGDLVNLGKKVKEVTQAGDVGTFVASVDQASAQALKSRLAFLESKAKLAEAFGLKAERYLKACEALRAGEQKTPTSGARATALGESRKVTLEADEELDAAMEAPPALSEEAKTKFSAGSEDFIDSVVQLKAELKTLQDLANQGKAVVKSANLLQKAKATGAVGPATQLAAGLAEDVKKVMLTLTKILHVAKTQELPLANREKAEEVLAEQ